MADGVVNGVSAARQDGGGHARSSLAPRERAGQRRWIGLAIELGVRRDLGERDVDIGIAPHVGLVENDREAARAKRRRKLHLV